MSETISWRFLAYQMPVGGVGLPSVEHTPLPLPPQLVSSGWTRKQKALSGLPERAFWGIEVP
jgi:hypothetical protein